MRAELKVQYRAKQRAQINERKTMDAKKRFSSYIFHEVRVPLNTARELENLSLPFFADLANPYPFISTRCSKS